MVDHSPFLAMCDMWGLETALEKARQFGLNVTEEEVKEAKRKEKKIADCLKDSVRAIRKKNDDHI